MSKIRIGRSGSKHIEIDVGVLLRTRLLIQGNSGAGKSYLVRRLSEQLFGKVQVILIDREGEFASLREKYGYVLAGVDGDTPADVRSARLLAEKLLELRASAICDLYEAFRTRPRQRQDLVRGFIEGLMDAPKKFWRDLVVIVDEAHLFAPEVLPKASDQKEREIISGCKDAMVALATAGRKRGFCATWATQRLAKLDKDGSAELLNRFVGQTIEDVDVDRACDLMSVSRDERATFKREIKNLEPGNFYGFGRAVSKDRILIRVGSVRTTHPESGSTKYAAAPPPPPEKIRTLLPKLKDLPQEVEAKAKNEAALQKEVRELKAKLVTYERHARATQGVKVKEKVIEVPRIKEKVIEVPILKPKEIKDLGRLVVRLEKAKSHLGETAQGVATASLAIARVVGDAVAGVAKLRARPREGPTACPPGPRGAKGTPGAAPRPARVAPAGPSPMEDTDLLKGERKMLEVLAQFHPGARTRSQLGALTGLTPSGGTFGNYYGRLKRRGLIKETSDEAVVITDEGLALFGGAVPRGPRSPEELLEMWRGKLLAGERRMLDAVMERYPEALTREELGEATGIAHTGGTFGNYLGTLRRNQLVVVEGDSVRAADVFFEVSGVS